MYIRIFKFLAVICAAVQSHGQPVIYVDREIAIQNAKLISMALCSHEANRNLIGGDPKKLSFFRFTVSKHDANSISVSGFCNLVQNHPSIHRERSTFNLRLTRVFQLNRKEGFDYGHLGSHKVRVGWVLVNRNPLLDPLWQSEVEVRYQTLELYPNLPLLDLWTRLNPLKVDVESISEWGFEGVALRNLRGISITKNQDEKTAAVYNLNYTNLEEHYRGMQSAKHGTQGVGINLNGTMTDTVYGCIYSSYFGDGSIETLMDRKRCEELKYLIR